MQIRDMRALFAALFVGLSVSPVFGQTPWVSPTYQAAATTGPSVPAALSDAGTTTPEKQIVGIGGEFSVPVHGLGSCPANFDKVVLQLNDIDSGIAPIGCSAGGTRFTFELDQGMSKNPSGPVWRMLLGNVWSLRQSNWSRRVYANVNATNSAGTVLSSDPVELSVRIVESGSTLFGAAALFVIAVAGLIALGSNSGMLRDANIGETETKAVRPYSLSRVQAAWWFAIVFASCISLWVLTGHWPVLGATALALLAISGGAGVAAIGIDSGSGKLVPVSQGFWKDILTDSKGITLARFQALIWNLTLGVYYPISGS